MEVDVDCEKQLTSSISGHFNAFLFSKIMEKSLDIRGNSSQIGWKVN